jgi:AraC family transcriptional regulator of adaptative response / DNA-3-methyladenine glycosylase II
MRALRDPDSFLPGDLGVRRALEQLGHDGRPAAASSVSQRWRPYRAYAVQYLWASLHAPGRASGAAPGARDADRLAA